MKNLLQTKQKLSALALAEDAVESDCLLSGNQVMIQPWSHIQRPAFSEEGVGNQIMIRPYTAIQSRCAPSRASGWLAPYIIWSPQPQGLSLELTNAVSLELYLCVRHIFRHL